MKVQGYRSVSGSHPALGKYKGVEIKWTAGPSKTEVVTTAKNFLSGTDILFETAFPSGAKVLK